MRIDNNEIIKDINANNQIISSMLKKSHLIIKLVYEIKKEKSIKLFDYNFIRQNKRKFKIIINNKLSKLTNNYKKIFDDNTGVFKMKILIMNNQEINFNKMFYNCSSLQNFSIKTKNEPKSKNKLIEEQNYNKINSLNINNSEEINKESSIEFKNNKKSVTNNSLEDVYSDLLYCLYNFDKENNIIVTGMRYMFYGCSSLKYISGLSKLNTIKVKSSRKTLNISVNI